MSPSKRNTALIGSSAILMLFAVKVFGLTKQLSANVVGTEIDRNVLHTEWNSFAPELGNLLKKSYGVKEDSVECMQEALIKVLNNSGCHYKRYTLLETNEQFLASQDACITHIGWEEKVKSAAAACKK